MRIILAAATIGACLAASYAAETFGQGALSVPHVQLTGASEASGLPALDGDKQQARAKPARRGGDDSCQWANDNECDDPGIGTGACRLGTDYSDCRNIREGENDSCQWARDGECDEPNFGTGACVQGSDHTDCGDIAWMRNRNDSCTTAFNNVCEEPGNGAGGCAVRTDRTDCNTRNRPMTINDHFFGRDDRVRVNANEAPWRFIGRLRMDTGESCTATLVGPDVIVTAAHCIHTANGVNAAGQFETAATVGGGVQRGRVIAYLVDRIYDYTRFTTTNDIDGADWALLRLDRRLGDRTGFAGMQNLTGQGSARANAAELYQAGYGWDTGEQLAGNVRCHMVRQYPDNTFAHECDTTRGDSGSSFMVRNGQGYDVIGIDSNFRSNPDGPFIYIAVSAASFQPQLAGFVAGRTGTPVGAAGDGKPKRTRSGL